MESSLESTLEKIKLQEHDKEAKLKEKRTHEAMLITLSRGVRDALSQAARLKHEHLESVSRVEALRPQLELEKARGKALASVLEDSQKELQLLQEKSTRGITAVWNLRSQLCKSVQEVSDQCDIWALLTKPKNIQLPIAKKFFIEENEAGRASGDKLKNAIERQTKLLDERDRLQKEPDIGEEFLRIKNALRYSASMAANLK